MSFARGSSPLSGMTGVGPQAPFVPCAYAVIADRARAANNDRNILFELTTFRIAILSSDKFVKPRSDVHKCVAIYWVSQLATAGKLTD